jgi:aromatic ring-opening dioxygenase catalytic subunit (LigB family)
MSAIHTALTSSKPLEGTMTLFRHPLYKQAHPTPEHLLPLVVAVAATEDGDTWEELFAGTAEDGVLGWGMWRWKPQQAAA